jgi:hypothetical protein
MTEIVSHYETAGPALPRIDKGPEKEKQGQTLYENRRQHHA